MAVTTYGLDTIAKLLDLTPRRVTQLVQQGVLPRAERGRYELVPVVRSYIRFLRERAVNGDVGADKIGEHRMRLVRARADLIEMEKAQLSGELIPAQDVQSAWSQMVMNMRQRLLSIPTRSAPQAYSAGSVVEAKAIIKDAVIEALAELSAIEVKLVEPVRSSVSGEDRADDDEDDRAAAGSDDQRVGGREPPPVRRGVGGARAVEDKPR